MTLQTALLSRDTLEFLTALRANNDRGWFEANKADYQAHLKYPAEAFAAALAEAIEAVTSQAQEYRIFRIHRDVRFAKDKTPYNAHLHISLSPGGGCRNGGPAWMLGLDPDRLSLGTGIFAFTPDQLDAWRTLLAGDQGPRISQMLDHLGSTGVRIGEPELKRVPAPYAAGHPQASLLRRKGLAAWIDIPDTGFALGAEAPVNCARELLRLRELFDLIDRL